jgi:hypothetical protein
MEKAQTAARKCRHFAIWPAQAKVKFSSRRVQDLAAREISSKSHARASNQRAESTNFRG